jgi:hypothetical protein
MKAATDRRRFERLVRDLLKVSDLPAAKPGLRAAHNRLSVGSRSDYRAALRKNFDVRQIRSLLKELQRSLPALNREIFRETDRGRLAATAAAFGVDLEVETFAGPEGEMLRGFYVNDSTLLKRPLIVVNGADQPVGVAAAFWHEMGHHLTHQMFGGPRDRFDPSPAAHYHDHLNQPNELIADLVMVLGGYPKVIAERLFGDLPIARGSLNVEVLIAKAKGHLRSVADFEFQPSASVQQKLAIAAGMIHAARLRAAMLDSFGI